MVTSDERSAGTREVFDFLASFVFAAIVTYAVNAVAFTVGSIHLALDGSMSILIVTCSILAIASIFLATMQLDAFGLEAKEYQYFAGAMFSAAIFLVMHVRFVHVAPSMAGQALMLAFWIFLVVCYVLLRRRAGRPQ